MPLFVEGPALRTFFSNSVVKGRESVSSAQATISNPPSFLWQMTSDQLVQFGQTRRITVSNVVLSITVVCYTLPSHYLP
jgi:hypothetical protein